MIVARLLLAFRQQRSGGARDKCRHSVQQGDFKHTVVLSGERCADFRTCSLHGSPTAWESCTGLRETHPRGWRAGLVLGCQFAGPTGFVWAQEQSQLRHAPRLSFNEVGRCLRLLTLSRCVVLFSEGVSRTVLLVLGTHTRSKPRDPEFGGSSPRTVRPRTTFKPPICGQRFPVLFSVSSSLSGASHHMAITFGGSLDEKFGFASEKLLASEQGSYVVGIRHLALAPGEVGASLGFISRMCRQSWAQVFHRLGQDVAHGGAKRIFIRSSTRTRPSNNLRRREIRDRVSEAERHSLIEWVYPSVRVQYSRVRSALGRLACNVHTIQIWCVAGCIPCNLALCGSRVRVPVWNHTAQIPRASAHYVPVRLCGFTQQLLWRSERGKLSRTDRWISGTLVKAPSTSQEMRRATASRICPNYPRSRAQQPMGLKVARPMEVRHCRHFVEGGQFSSSRI